MKVLVAEDDANIRAGLIDVLENEGYHTVEASTGEEALEVYQRERPDFICLDIMMPGVDGYEVCKRIRRVDSAVPVIFISAKSEEIDRVLGLELGADDFITKPFGVREVIARIRAVTRRCLAVRSNTPRYEPFEMGDLGVFPSELRARREGETIELSFRDVRILELLHRHQGEAVDRETFFNECWGLDHMPNSRTLDQHISQLRKRIEKDHKNPAIIRMVHGVGYRYDG